MVSDSLQQDHIPVRPRIYFFSQQAWEYSRKSMALGGGEGNVGKIISTQGRKIRSGNRSQISGPCKVFQNFILNVQRNIV